ncbi:MAG: BamA/TamA family outer membrane protein, partial [Acidobacteria bacterium]|nr:BamA/TamA family outer membrane protein [Acidobacteriota bacterium]
DGLRRTPQPIVTSLAGLRPGQRLTANAFTRAARRLEEFPSASRASLNYTPVADGRVSMTAVVNERPVVPSGLVDWGSVAVDAAITKTIRVDLAAPFSQGDLWEPSFRWPRERRRIALDLALPVPGGRPGLLHVDTFWERQTYARPLTATGRSEEIRRRIGAKYSDWLFSTVRVEVGAAADRFDSQRYLALLGGATARAWRDHIATHVRVEHWLSPGNDRPAHSTMDAAVDWRSTTEGDRPRWTARIGAAMASHDAPLALWPGAGSRDRTAVLRGRRLVSQHVVSGEVFGRRLLFASAERQHPVWRPRQGLVSLAGFMDAAKAWDRLDGQPDSRLHVDVGVGLRLAQPGGASQIRVDWGVGLRDGRMRVSAGYVTGWGRR